eukprot:5245678-Amphidinium_carterae.1
MTGSYLCRERLSRRQKDPPCSPMCSLCGELDTIEHIVMHCSALPDNHRSYVQGLSNGNHRTLLTRTALPADSEEVRSAGKSAYIVFTHHLASCLVRRNVLDADAPQRWPKKLRLVGKQPRPVAYALAEGGTRVPAKKVRKPNLAAR